MVAAARQPFDIRWPLRRSAALNSGLRQMALSLPRNGDFPHLSATSVGGTRSSHSPQAADPRALPAPLST